MLKYPQEGPNYANGTNLLELQIFEHGKIQVEKGIAAPVSVSTAKLDRRACRGVSKESQESDRDISGSSMELL